MKCPCPKLESGEKAYDCELYGCRMYPHFCEKTLEDHKFRELYLSQNGPTQNIEARRGVVKWQSPLVTERLNGDKEKKIRKGGCGGKAARVVWDLTKSVGSYIASGLKNVSQEEYQERLAVCDVCEHRGGKRKNRCMLCLCYIAIKAKARVWTCPDGRWKKL